MNPKESSGHDGAPLCECRAPPEPASICSDVEPKCIRYLSFFWQQRRSRVGMVKFLILIMQTRQGPLNRNANLCVACCRSWTLCDCISVLGKNAMFLSRPPPQKQISKQTNKPQHCLFTVHLLSVLSQDVSLIMFSL